MKLESFEDNKLQIFVQLNSSGEDSKGGVSVDVSSAAYAELDKVVGCLLRECPRLQLAGLMTIGAPDYSGCRSEDFELMLACRAHLVAAFQLKQEDLQLSMGMSNDFENAIVHGSTSVRVGSAIFGARAPKVN